ncbi:MAG: molybdate ABC transporter substrate-binding protein [Sarcina sp.]
MYKKFFSILLIGVILSTTLLACSKTNSATKDQSLTVSIAASLQGPMQEIGDNFSKKTNIKINYNIGGSGTLKKQIVNGAPCDIFFSANTQYVEDLVHNNLVNKNSVFPMLNNSLVLIGPNDLKTNITSLEDLKNINGKIGIGDINTVPAGQYAKQSLDHLNLWNSLNDKMIFCKSVSSVKNYVESGETTVGFVYKTDALKLKNSKIIYEIPNDYHKAIQYEACILETSENKNTSKEFIDYLKSPEAIKIFESYGFKGSAK